MCVCVCVCVQEQVRASQHVCDGDIAQIAIVGIILPGALEVVNTEILHGRKERRKGGKEGRKEGRTDGRKGREGRRTGRRKEGKKEGREGGRKEGRKEGKRKVWAAGKELLTRSAGGDRWSGLFLPNRRKFGAGLWRSRTWQADSGSQARCPMEGVPAPGECAGASAVGEASRQGRQVNWDWITQGS